MSEDELVGGDVGYVSDESSFYGEEATKKDLERRCMSQIQILYNPFAKRTKAEEPRKKKIKLDSKAEPEAGLKAKPEAGSKAESKAESKSERTNGNSVVDFLKSRPQIAALETSATRDRKKTVVPTLETADSNKAAELVQNDRFRSDSASWQQSETIDDFLKRCPVADPETAGLGPWLWVGNPHSTPAQKRREEDEDLEAFMATAKELFRGFAQQKSEIENENPDKPPATITRKMGPHRDKLEEDLLHAAVETSTTCGKWMLFPGPTDLPRYWRIVAEATSQGKLGPVSKVGTYDPFDGKQYTLICVYTYDFTDSEDVRRVLEKLCDLELCTKGAKPIYYKCDAYTYLGITSENEYKLRASLFSSRDLLENNAKASKDGPVARLKQRDQKLDGFLF